MTKIVIEQPDGASRVVKDKSFDLERLLQENIRRLPDLIPIEEVAGEPVRLLPIGVEVTVPTGAVDLLLVGSDGVLTIVETKLARNPESRREVIGQLLEYAAYISEWGLEEIEREAERYFASEECAEDYRDSRLEAALTRFLDLSESDCADLDAFLNQLDKNLKAGKLRLIVAADRLVETARKTITFVNTYSAFEMYLLQITCYEDEAHTRIYVPSLHGYARKVKPPPPPKPWTWERYESELGWSTDIVQRAKSLISGLERLAQGWEPETRFHAGWISVHCFGKEAFGVQNFKKTGLNLWFRLDQDPKEGFPEAVIPRKTKSYLYLSGRLDGLRDDQLHRLCEAALRQVGAETRS